MSEKRYRAVIYVDINVPDDVTINDVANETAKKDATFVAEQVEGIHLTVEEFQTLIQKAGYLNG